MTAETLKKALDEVIDVTIKTVERDHGIQDDKILATPFRRRRSDADASQDMGVQRLTGITPLFATCDRPLQMTVEVSCDLDDTVLIRF